MLCAGILKDLGKKLGLSSWWVDSDKPLGLCEGRNDAEGTEKKP